MESASGRGFDLAAAWRLRWLGVFRRGLRGDVGGCEVLPASRRAVASPRSAAAPGSSLRRDSRTAWLAARKSARPPRRYTFQKKVRVATRPRSPNSPAVAMAATVVNVVPKSCPSPPPVCGGELGGAPLLSGCDLLGARSEQAKDNLEKVSWGACSCWLGRT